MNAFIAGIEYFLPQNTLSTEELSARFPSWSVEAIDAKTGIHSRHVADPEECASDFAVSAAVRLFQSGICCPEEVDFVLLCTQSPDYVVPTTACLLQSRLGIRTGAGALDYNLGCSGFVYGLGLCEGLVASGQAKTLLLITAETYSKYLAESDKTSRTIFGDGAAVTLIRSRQGCPSIGPFIYGTDGAGAENLIVPNRSTRNGTSSKAIVPNGATCDRKQNFLYMNGAKVFEFAIDTIPTVVGALLDRAELELHQIDLFVFHQANAYLLEALRKQLKIPPEKFVVVIGHCANTVSSTIPVALKHAEIDGKLKSGHIVMLVGFGAGYSWAASIVRWAV